MWLASASLRLSRLLKAIGDVWRLISLWGFNDAIGGHVKGFGPYGKNKELILST
jgi:hypothetical protein